jgi:hypothetical protein
LSIRSVFSLLENISDFSTNFLDGFHTSHQWGRIDIVVTRKGRIVSDRSRIDE